MKWLQAAPAFSLIMLVLATVVPLMLETADTALRTREKGFRIMVSWFDESKPWKNVIAQTVTPVVAATVNALRTGSCVGLKQLASPASLEAFIHIIVKQIASTPEMVTSTDNIEVNRLVAAVAAAMAADENLLLTQDDWLTIVAVAAEEVAANPGRLLGSKDTGSGTLLSMVLGDLIQVAERAMAEARSQGQHRVVRTDAARSHSVDDYLARNLNAARCTRQGLVGRPSSATDAALQPLIDSKNAAEDALRGASISTQCATG